jgi:transcriptional/translational regulatory protein YebC/TACO1
VFERKANFTIKNNGENLEDLELDLIDAGLEEIEGDAEEIFIVTKFTDFGAMQKALEAKGYEILSAEKVRTPLSTVEVTDEQREQIEKMVEKFEDDDDVQQVFTNMA